MQKKKILVFGAAGFIGTYLIDQLLNEGYKIIATDISAIGVEYYKERGIPYFLVDLVHKQSFDQLKDLNVDLVIHLAALQPANFDPYYHTPKDYISTNVLGTLHILEFCKEKKVGKIIYASSHRNTSGLWSSKKSIKETDGTALNYNGEYAMFSISESYAQDCIHFYSANHAIDSIIFRLPPVYGYGPHLEIFKDSIPIKTGFQTFIESAKAEIPIELWGDSAIGRDIIYVKDVVSAFVKVLKNNHITGLYNITSNYALTLKEEIETIAKIFWPKGSDPIIIPKPEKTHYIDAFQYDNSKAKMDFCWEPEYNFEQLVLDYDKESKTNRFAFLLEKRKAMFERK